MDQLTIVFYLVRLTGKCKKTDEPVTAGIRFFPEPIIDKCESGTQQKTIILVHAGIDPWKAPYRVLKLIDRKIIIVYIVIDHRFCPSRFLHIILFIDIVINKCLNRALDKYCIITLTTYNSESYRGMKPA